MEIKLTKENFLERMRLMAAAINEFIDKEREADSEKAKEIAYLCLFTAPTPGESNKHGVGALCAGGPFHLSYLFARAFSGNPGIKRAAEVALAAFEDGGPFASSNKQTTMTAKPLAAKEKADVRSKVAKACFCLGYLWTNDFITERAYHAGHEMLEAYQTEYRMEISQEQIDSCRLLYNDRAGQINPKK